MKIDGSLIFYLYIYKKEYIKQFSDIIHKLFYIPTGIDNPTLQDGRERTYTIIYKSIK
jgi:hypothetical protein